MGFNKIFILFALLLIASSGNVQAATTDKDFRNLHFGMSYKSISQLVSKHTNGGIDFYERKGENYHQYGIKWFMIQYGFSNNHLQRIVLHSYSYKPARSDSPCFATKEHKQIYQVITQHYGQPVDKVTFSSSRETYNRLRKELSECMPATQQKNKYCEIYLHEVYAGEQDHRQRGLKVKMELLAGRNQQGNDVLCQNRVTLSPGLSLEEQQRQDREDMQADKEMSDMLKEMFK